MELRYRKITDDQFRGIDHAEYELSDRVYVEAMNAGGKTTTFADSIFWLFTDKDYGLTSNPEVHNIYKEESEPSVEVLCEVRKSGDEEWESVSLRKFQKDSRTRKQKEEGAPVRISNQYTINDVPKSQKDFVKALEEYGIDVEKFPMLSHPDYFMDAKRTPEKDRRNILFAMTKAVTDKELADALGFAEISELLEKKKPEEIIATTKRDQKEAKENLDVIPEQIIGMERSKVSLDVDEYNAQKATLENEIKELEEKVMEMRLPSLGDLNQEFVRLKREGDMILAAANSERVAKLTEMNALIGELRNKYKETEHDKEQTANAISELVAKKNSLSERFQFLSEEYQRVKASEFDGVTVCQYCGQDLPIHQIDKLRVEFEENKKQQMADINAEALNIKKQIPVINARIEEYNNALKELEKSLVKQHAEIESKSKEREKYEHVIDATGSKEYSECLSKQAEVQHKINRLDELKSQEDYLMAQMRDRKEAIREIDATLGQLKVNERIDQQIAEAKAMQSNYRQKEADAQKILDQMAQISMKKNEMLTDEVNSHFKLVKFKLFDQQKNGEFKDCCIPMIRNEKSEYMQFGQSANTALEVMGKLDIIAGLQDFYDMHIPVILDGAECLDAKTMAGLSLPDTQLITLAVSDTPLTVRCE